MAKFESHNVTGRSPAFLCNPTLSQDIKNHFPDLFPLKVLRCYSQEFTDFTTQINVIAQRNYPGDPSLKFVLCEWIQDGKAMKYSVNVELIAERTLHFGDYYFPTEIEKAFARFLSRQPKSFF